MSTMAMQGKQQDDRGILHDKSRAELLKRIDKIPGFERVRVVYFDGQNVRELRPHPPLCAERLRTVVIRPAAKEQISRITHPTISKSENNRFVTELVSTGLSCGAAVLSWIVVGGSTVAIPVSGGTSTVITMLGYGAATASSLQCANSGVRLFNESDFGNAEVNRWLDSEDWYNHTLTALDVLSVAGGIASAGATLKAVINLGKSGVSLREALKQLSRHERKRLTQEIIRANNPGISNKVMKAMVAAGKYPKRYASADISNALRLQLKDAVAATLSFSGSATGGVIREPRRIRDFVIGVVDEFETY